MVNPLLFPNDFDVQVRDDLADAVRRLNAEAIATARQQANTRRINGQQTVGVQNLRLWAVPGLMPILSVGRFVPPPAPPAPVDPPPLTPPTNVVQPTAPMVQPSTTGTVGVFGGGYNLTSGFDRLDQLTYSNQAIEALTTRLSENKVYTATVGNQEQGLFCSGVNGSVIIDVYRYASKTAARSGTSMVQPRIGATGGIQDRSKGLVVGGGGNWRVATRHLQRVSFGPPIVVAYVADFLSARRISPHNGLCSASYGYIYSGGANSVNDVPLNTIERIYFPTIPELIAMLGTTITQSNFHLVHAAFGNKTKAFLTGGHNTGHINGVYHSDLITKFSFATETPAILAAKLTESRTCAVGTGDHYGGYTLGGHSTQPVGTRTIDRVDYGIVPEPNRRIAAQLSQQQSDMGAVSDYGAGFS
jgi:hypothetical protein